MFFLYSVKPCLASKLSTRISSATHMANDKRLDHLSCNEEDDTLVNAEYLRCVPPAGDVLVGEWMVGVEKLVATNGPRCGWLVP